MNSSYVQSIKFPEYSGIRCLMMPYIQGNPDSVPDNCAAYRQIIETLYFRKGDIGFLTIDESRTTAGKPHRGQRARYSRALHTEAGKHDADTMPIYCWGDVPTWGGKANVALDRDVQILLANNLDNSCAVWDAEHENTSSDGDIGYAASEYPYHEAVLMKASDVHRIGIFTPHESLPVAESTNRQFLRIISAGVHGREPYFTQNPRVDFT